MNLTEQHFTLLQAAAERDGGLLPRPDRLVGAARRRMADRLLTAGVAEIAQVAAGQPHWFATAEGPTSLRITGAGRSVVSCKAPSENFQDTSHADPDALPSAAKQGRVHRCGTKRALLIDLLRRDGGATIEALTDALGWQAHTVRAALTRLRQDGVVIDKAAGEGGSLYRIDADVAAGASIAVGADA